MSDRETKPRVWTLRNNCEREVQEADSTPAIEPGDEVRVVELEPVLDLLERVDRECKLALNDGQTRAAWTPVEALLQAHGRLDAT